MIYNFTCILLLQTNKLQTIDEILLFKSPFVYNRRNLNEEYIILSYLKGGILDHHHWNTL